MKYFNKTFSVGYCSEQYRNNWENCFKKHNLIDKRTFDPDVVSLYVLFEREPENIKSKIKNELTTKQLLGLRDMFLGHNEEHWAFILLTDELKERGEVF